MLYPHSADNKVEAKLNSRSSCWNIRVYIFVREIGIAAKALEGCCLLILSREDENNIKIIFNILNLLSFACDASTDYIRYEPLFTVIVAE